MGELFNGFVSQFPYVYNENYSGSYHVYTYTCYLTNACICIIWIYVCMCMWQILSEPHPYPPQAISHCTPMTSNCPPLYLLPSFFPKHLQSLSAFVQKSRSISELTSLGTSPPWINDGDWCVNFSISYSGGINWRHYILYHVPNFPCFSVNNGDLFNNTHWLSLLCCNYFPFLY